MAGRALPTATFTMPYRATAPPRATANPLRKWIGIRTATIGSLPANSTIHAAFSVVVHRDHAEQAVVVLGDGLARPVPVDVTDLEILEILPNGLASPIGVSPLGVALGDYPPVGPPH